MHMSMHFFTNVNLPDHKLSKYETLQMAQTYIGALASLMERAAASTTATDIAAQNQPGKGNVIFSRGKKKRRSYHSFKSKQTLPHISIISMLKEIVIPCLLLACSTSRKLLSLNTKCIGRRRRRRMRDI